MNIIDSNIRRIIESDFKNIIRIEAKIFPEDFFLSEENVIEIVNDHNKEFYIIQLKDNIIGYMIINFMDKILHLYRIGIIPEYQGEGYGTKLMEFLSIRIKELNFFDESILYVLRGNDAAINLYKKFQYEIVKRSWQFQIEYDQIKPSSENTDEYSSKIIPYSKDELERISKLYDVTIERLNNLISPKNLFIEFYLGNKSIGFCRFDPTFPGAFPFIIEHIDFYAISNELIKYAKPDFDFVKVTFDENEQLAQFLQEEKFICVHEMFVMERKL